MAPRLNIVVSTVTIVLYIVGLRAQIITDDCPAPRPRNCCSYHDMLCMSENHPLCTVTIPARVRTDWCKVIVECPYGNTTELERSTVCFALRNLFRPPVNTKANYDIDTVKYGYRLELFDKNGVRTDVVDSLENFGQFEAADSLINQLSIRQSWLGKFKITAFYNCDFQECLTPGVSQSVCHSYGNCSRFDYNLRRRYCRENSNMPYFCLGNNTHTSKITNYSPEDLKPIVPDSPYLFKLKTNAGLEPWQDFQRCRNRKLFQCGISENRGCRQMTNKLCKVTYPSSIDAEFKCVVEVECEYSNVTVEQTSAECFALATLLFKTPRDNSYLRDDSELASFSREGTLTFYLIDDSGNTNTTETQHDHNKVNEFMNNIKKYNETLKTYRIRGEYICHNRLPCPGRERSTAPLHRTYPRPPPAQ